MLDFIRRIQKCDQGATALEYVLIAALVAVATMVGMRSLGTALNTQFDTVSKKLNVT
jgi:pilus assembly protein Flp/PilA